MNSRCSVVSIVRFGALVAGLLACAPVASEAKNLYVNGATGNDAVTYAANSDTNPWRTIGRAAWGSTNRDARNGSQAAQAGDVVLVASGTYSGVGTGSRNEILYYSENNGTASSPIVFRAVGPVQLTLSSGMGAMIGSYNRNYITWDGFSIHEANAPSVADTGPVSVTGCTGCVLQNLDINGNGNDNNRADNHNGIRIERSFQILVRNNRIQNVFSGSPNPNNGAAIMMYGSGALTFEHNEIFNCGSGIFLKGGPTDQIDFFTIRFNLFYNIGENRAGGASGNAIIMHAGAPTTAARPTRIYQNIVYNSLDAAVRIWRFSATDPLNTPMNGQIVNNTFYNVPVGLWVDNELLPNAGFIFKNNVVSNTSRQAIAFNGVPNDKTRFDSENNLFWNYPTMASTASGNYALPAWKSTYGQDNASPTSVNVDPRFANAAGLDFHLQGGSPALTLGRDVFDLNGNGSTTDMVPAGAYVIGNEIIGRTTAPVSSTPMTPTGLRIVPQN